MRSLSLKKRVGIIIADTSRNLDPALKETIVVNVRSDTETSPLAITLTEVDVNSGIFTGALVLSEDQPSSDGILQVSLKDKIEATYLDSSSQSYSSTASIALSTITILGNRLKNRGLSIVANDTGGMPMGIARLDSSGKALVYVREGTQVKFRVTCGGMFICETDFVVTPVNMTISLPEPTVVTVLDNNDIGVSGLVVQGVSIQGEGLGYIFTDSSGKAYCYLKEGAQVKFRIFQGNYFIEETGSFTVPADITINLPQPTIITVIENGIGVKGAVFTVIIDGCYNQFSTIDSSGRAYCYIKEGEQMRVKFEAGMLTLFDQYAIAPANLTINLPRLSTVTLLKDGLGLSGRYVYAYSASGSYLAAGVTDSSGKYSFYIPEGMSVRFEADYGGMLKTGIVTAPADVTITVPDPSTITVLANGIGVAGAWVYAYDTSGKELDAVGLTDPSGRADLHIPPGLQVKCKVQYSNRKTFAGESGFFTTPADVTIALPEPITTTVTVLDEGMAVSRFPVSITTNTGQQIDPCFTDSSGKAYFNMEKGTLAKFAIYCGSLIETDFVTTPTEVTINIPHPCVVTVLKDGVGVYGVRITALDANGPFLQSETDYAGKAYFYLKEGAQVKFGVQYGFGFFESDVITAPTDVTMNVPDPTFLTVLRDDAGVKRVYAYAYDINGNYLCYVYTDTLGRGSLHIADGMQIRFKVSDNGKDYYSNFITTPGEATIDISENQPPVLPPIENKSIPEGQLLEFTVSATDPNSNPLTFTRPLPNELPSGAAFVDHGNGTGTFSWTPAYTQARSDAYMVPFQVSDGSLFSQPASASITVQNVLVSGTIYEKVSATENRPSDGAVVSVLNLSKTQTLASATTDAQGKFYITSNSIPDGTYFIHASKDGYKSYTGMATLRNSQNLPFTATLAANHPPTIYAGDHIIKEGEELYFDVFARDADLDELHFTVTGLPQGAIFPDGIILPTPGVDEETIAIFHWKPAYNQAEVYPITLTVTDSGGLSASKPITITVQNVLVFGTIYKEELGVKLGLEGAAVSVLNIDRTPAAISPALTDANGKFAIVGSLPDGNYFIKTEKEGHSTYSGTTLLRNTQALPFSVTFYAPVMGALSDATLQESQPFSLTVSATDLNSDKLSFSATGLPTGATLQDNANNTATLSWSPTHDQSGSHTVQFKVTDGLLSDTKSATFKVNTAPEMSTIGNKTIEPGKKLAFTVTAIDKEGNTLTFSAGTLPPGAAFNSTTHLFSWVPTNKQIGTYQIAFNVSDGKLISSETITVTVKKTNKSPKAIISAVPQSGRAPLIVRFAGVRSYDPDGKIVSYLWSFGDGATSTTINATHTYQNASRLTKIYTATLTVADNEKAKSDAKVLINVLPRR